MRTNNFFKEKSNRLYGAMISAVFVLTAMVVWTIPALAAEKIKLGICQPITGPIADIGKDIANGAKVAVSMINEKGGVGVRGKKYLFETIVYDDKCKPPDAVAAVRKMITINKVKFIVGPTCSSAARAVLEIIEEPKVLIFTSGTAVKVTENPYAFRVSVPSAGLAPFYVSYFMKKQGIKNIAFLAQNDRYGRGIVKIYQKQIEKQGGKIVGVEYHDRGATDLYPQLTKIKALSFDALFLAIPGKSAGFAMKQAKELGIKQTIIGTEAIATEEPLMAAGKASEGIVFPYTYNWKSDNPRTKEYVQKYQKMFYRDANQLGGAGSCDGVLMLAAAMEAAGTVTDTDAIKKTLLEIDFKGITSAYGYNAGGELKVEPFLMKIHNGERVLLEE